MKLFILLLAAHVCGDIVFNFLSFARKKRSEKPFHRVQAIGFHCAVHGLLVIIWLWPFNVWLKCWSALYVFVSHFLIDHFRTHAEMKMVPQVELRVVPKKQALLYFFGRANPDMNAFLKKHVKTWAGMIVLDQGLHVVTIAAFAIAAQQFGWT